MRYLLGLLVLLNILDGIVTHFVIESGAGREGNPFLLHIVDEPVFIIIKIIGVIICALILWDVYRRHPRLALVFASCFVAVYTTIVLWNSSLFLS